MRIGASNYEQGNKAMASVLLLYYHLASSGGFTGDETVFISPEEFDGYSYLDAEVTDGYETEIDEKLIREGAVIYLLCELNDMICEYEDNFFAQETTQKIIKAYEKGKLTSISETSELFKLFNAPKSNFNLEAYFEIMRNIINKYVVGTFNELTSCVKP